ncbi:TonB-dependent receptor [uncultured Psychrobacter sp.]|uniref:TonB-dependent receptor plug domain-containing protein n=1 Tax=uncultured Psychrobacter sp. TaxID=259303 RepID=UPI0026397B59|nr:TonB-dependent receptor [uncultured Psychrobacter sp.]
MPTSNTFKASYKPLSAAITLVLAVMITANAKAADPYQLNSLADSEQSLANSAMPSTVLDPIVVTATRSKRALSDAPVKVDVISSKQIEDNHAHTLKEALELLPNVYLKQVHGKTGYEVSMQGFTGDQVLVLIDGLPITASTGSTVNLNQYMTMDIEQIEVVQGAASAQFGSAAMGGVINIITKPTNKTKAYVNTELVTNGDQNPSGDDIDANKRFIAAGIEGALDPAQRLQARLSASYLDDDGLNTDTARWPRIKDASEQTQVTGRLSYTPDDRTMLTHSKLWAEASRYSEDDTSRFNLRVAQNILPQQREESINKDRISIGGSTDIHLNENTQTYQLSAQALYEDYQSDSDTLSNEVLASARNTNITTALGQVQLDLPAIDSGAHMHLLQVGGQVQRDTLSQTKNSISELISDEVSRDVGELYLQDDWLIGDHWEILTGIRYQDDQDFGDHVAPKVAVKYNRTDASGRDHIFRASVGSGYRVPNLKERYYVFDHSNLGYKVMGNPSLQPETSTSYQVGYQGQIGDDLNLSINGFYNDVEDLIQTDNENAIIENGIRIFQYTNIDSAYTYGGDIGIDWQVDDRATLQATYAYLKTKNESANSELTYRPNHKVMLALDYQLSDTLQLIPRLNYESKQLIDTAAQSYSPSWWTLDSQLNYKIDDNFSLYGAVNNIFDTQRDVRDTSDYRPIDNREWLIGARFNWQ